MELEKKYRWVKFSPEVIEESKGIFFKKIGVIGVEPNLIISTRDERWKYDTEAEFFAHYIKDTVIYASITYFCGQGMSFDVKFSRFGDPEAEVSVEGPNREIIETVFRIFDSSEKRCLVPKPEKPPWESQVKIFIGHGGKPLWKDLKAHLQDQHNFNVSAYESGARAGHVIRNILEELLSESTFAILVFTGENKDSEGNLHARENVIHEFGLFQGQLGHKRAIVLLEDGVEKFSNIEGVQYISFPKDGIETTYGDILATISREFKPK